MRSAPAVDARARKTRRRLRNALTGLVHEKGYDTIVVNDILERADVGRSAFYAHFQNKDDLLASGIDQILHTSPPRELPSSIGPLGKAVWFSLPFFEFVGQCRHTSALTMGGDTRAAVHHHLHRGLVERITDDIKAMARSQRGEASKVPPGLLADYIVGTFILVLNWWVETKSPLSPREVDDVFLTLVGPTLGTAARG